MGLSNAEKQHRYRKRKAAAAGINDVVDLSSQVESVSSETLKKPQCIQHSRHNRSTRNLASQRARCNANRIKYRQTKRERYHANREKNRETKRERYNKEREKYRDILYK